MMSNKVASHYTKESISGSYIMPPKCINNLIIQLHPTKILWHISLNHLMDDCNFSYITKLKNKRGKRKHQLHVLCSITNVTSHIFMNGFVMSSIYYKLEKVKSCQKLKMGILR
jgi:hypothetical protein